MDSGSYGVSLLTWLLLRFIVDKPVPLQEEVEFRAEVSCQGHHLQDVNDQTPGKDSRPFEVHIEIQPSYSHTNLWTSRIVDSKRSDAVAVPTSRWEKGYQVPHQVEILDEQSQGGKQFRTEYKLVLERPKDHSPMWFCANKKTYKKQQDQVPKPLRQRGAKECSN